MDRLRRLAMAAALLCVALAAIVDAAAAKPPRAGQLDKGFGNGGKLIPAVPMTKAWPEGAPPPVTALAPDGSVVLVKASRVYAFEANGSPDRSFGTHGSAAVPAPAGYEFQPAGVAIDSRGRVLVAGTAVSIAGPGKTPAGFSLPTAATVIVERLLPDGKPDPSFGAGGVAQPSLGLPAAITKTGGQNEEVTASYITLGSTTLAVGLTGLAVDRQDRPILVGTSAQQLKVCTYSQTQTYAEPAFAARLTSSGSLDGGFGENGVLQIRAEEPVGPAALPGGGFALATAGQAPCARFPQEVPKSLSIYGPTGSSSGGASLQAPWGNPTTTVQAIAVDAHGRTLVLGEAEFKKASREFLARYRPSGAIDQSFGSKGTAWLNIPGGFGSLGLTVDRAGRPLIADVPEGEEAPLLLLRLSRAGKPDAGFGKDGLVTTKFGATAIGPTAVAVDAKNRITVSTELTCGFHTTPCRSVLVRYHGGKS